MLVDNANLTISKPFLYTENPNIKRITPDQSYLSGGRILSVLGERFQSIQTPKMGVYYRKQLINETYCTIVNNTLMFCPTPSVKEFTRNFRLINGGQQTSNSLANTFENQIEDLDFLSPSAAATNNNLNQLDDHQKRKTMLKLKISFGLDNSLRTLPLIGEQPPASKSQDLHNQNNYLDQDDQQQAGGLIGRSEVGEQEEQEDEKRNYFTISYVSDPKVYKLDQSASSFSGDSLVIQGENLNYAISSNELNVTIAGAPCSLISLTENQLVCSAIVQRKWYKDKSTIESKSNSNLLSSLLSIRESDYEEEPVSPLPVVVRYSENLEFHLGYLTSDDSTHFRKLNHKNENSPDAGGGLGNERFFSGENNRMLNGSERTADSRGLIKGAIISGVLLIILCLILLISFRRKSNEVEKQYKQMQLMIIDSLENSVRLECKQAFVDQLQTDLTGVSGGGEVNNLKSEDYNVVLLPIVQYISNIFFPGLDVNPLSPDYKVRTQQNHIE